MKYKLKLLCLVSTLLLLTGCAKTPNVSLSKNFWQNHKQKVNIASSKPTSGPQTAALYQEGAEGILDYMVNGAITDKFQTYLKSYPMQTVTNIKWTFLKKLKARKISAKIYNKPINVSKLANYSGDKTKVAVKDYKPFVAKIGPNKLLVISVDRIGAERKYYGFIPLGAPKAVCDLTGKLINVKNNRVLWRYAADVSLAVSGKWDQPPKYPNFTKTLKKAVASAQCELLNDFFMKS